MKINQLKILPNKKPGSKGMKRRIAAQLLSLVLLGGLFAAQQVTAVEMPGLHKLQSMSSPKRVAAEQNEKTETMELEKARSLWSAAAIVARPLVFEHEDCELFQGKKKVGNFGVFWPKKIQLPTDGAFRRYVQSEKRIVNYIVDELGAGPEQNLTIYQMAQMFSFVYNTTVASGEKALTLLKTGGMQSSQNFMSRIDRVKGMKEPLAGLAQRRKDEVKLGKGDLDAPLSRKREGGKHHTLTSLQADYNEFVSRLGVTTRDETELRAPRPAGNRADLSNGRDFDPI